MKNLFPKLGIFILISQVAFAERTSKDPIADSISVKAFLASALANKEREVAGLRAKIDLLARYPDFNEELKDISIKPTEFRALVFDAPSLNFEGLILGPVLENGKILGYQITAIDPQHAYYILGLRRGDLIRSLNGSSPSEMDAMYGVWQELKSSLSKGKFSKLIVEISRGSVNKKLTVIPLN